MECLRLRPAANLAGSCPLSLGYTGRCLKNLPFGIVVTCGIYDILNLGFAAPDINAVSFFQAGGCNHGNFGPEQIRQRTGKNHRHGYRYDDTCYPFSLFLHPLPKEDPQKPPGDRQKQRMKVFRRLFATCLRKRLSLLYS